MTREHAAADLVVHGGTVHHLADGTPPATTLAVRDGLVVAVAGPDAAQDLLQRSTGPGTTVVVDPDLVVLPAFVDTHNHLMLAGRNVLGVPVADARDIGEFVAAVRQRAARTPPGQWIVTGAEWHEMQLAERRMPTAAELDAATTEHPVVALRGGHNAVLNSAALRQAGIGPATSDVPAGFIARDGSGRPTGWLQDAALEPVLRVLPPPAAEDLMRGLAQASAHYAALGIGTVRDPAVSPAEWRTYRTAEAAGQLRVRSQSMIMTTPSTVAATGSFSAYLDSLEAQGIAPGAGQGRLHVWGLKLVLDGGVEAAALEEPYADRPDFRGELLWERPDLVEALACSVQRGWPVGTHAFGDRAVGVLLDAVATVVERTGPVCEGMLVVEHAGLIAADRVAQAAALGVHLTVQQALLDGLARPLLAAWGPGRTAGLFPLRALVDAGVPISAGTDHPIGPLNPMRGLHGMTTRRTTGGVLGPEHAVTRTEALRLYTHAGARLLGRPHGASLVAGAPADLVAYRSDPLTCPTEDLLELAPVLTVVGGEVVHRVDG
ncbi:MAG TPA: amidohydrolase [Kineosporiaceae bacterium]